MAKLSVSGKIIQEVSHSVPGTKYAIIELIKNAYEAKANRVTVDISNEEIIINDDGNGMNSEEIGTLLTVSDSNKVFGQEINGRLISGEKGLGFFSAFKFGNKINVSTYKDGIHSSFELDMKEISKQKNLYHFDIPIKESDYDDPNLKGTKISITELYSENFTLFKEKIDDEAEYLRLCNVIDDPDFQIEIKKSWGSNFNESLSELKLEEAKQVNAYFDSMKSLNLDGESKKYFIKLTRNSNEYQVPIEAKYEKLFDIKGFSMRINIDIYSLKGLSRKDVPKLYHDTPRNRIIPIIYINNCLFDNYAMYNPEINASENNKFVFRQQTGKIDLYLRSPRIISFNADRTQMTESSNSKLFQEFLNFFSSTIQKELRKILDEEEENKPKVLNRRSFINSKPSIDNGNHEIVTIKQNGIEKSEVLTDKEGIWEVTYSNGDKIILTIEKRPDPVIKQVNQSFIVGREYSFEELFTFRDCENGTKIKPLEFIVTPEECRSINYSTRKITFNKPSEVHFEIKIMDKISEIKLNAEYVGKSVFPKSNALSGTYGPSTVIHPLMEIDQNVKPDIIEFKNQLNNLYRSGKYEVVFISSLRTFVELVVNDIIEKLGKTQDEKLHVNYNLINKDENIKDRFINLIPSTREKAGIKAIYEQAIHEGRYRSTVKYLNLSTHAAQRIISMKQIESDFPVINLIYTYLCFLSK